MSTYEYLEQKVKLGVKIPSFFIQTAFLLQCSCILVPRELDHDIWQIIFELVVFYEMIISQAQSPLRFELDGGYEFLNTLYTLRDTFSKSGPSGESFSHRIRSFSVIWFSPIVGTRVSKILHQF